ncbi:MAG: hypothetical protein VW378_02425 [bacterium]
MKRIIIVIVMAMALQTSLSAYVAFSSFGDPPFSFISTSSSDETLSLETVKKQALSWPNPFYINKGGFPTLFYYLESAETIKINIYNSIGNALFTKVILRNQAGAKQGVNKVEIKRAELANQYFTPGVYLFLIYEKDSNTLLYKGKIAVQP